MPRTPVAAVRSCFDIQIIRSIFNNILSLSVVIMPKRYIRCISIFCLLTFWAYELHAQAKTGKARIDSLQNELAKAPEDTNKVRLLNGISFTYHLIDPAKGIQAGEQGYNLAKKLGWKKGMAMLDNTLGNNYRIKSDYAKALDYFFRSLKVNEEINERKGIANNFGNIGIVYKTQGDYKLALEYYAKALEMFEELGDKGGMATNLGNIGITYEMLKDYPASLRYQQKALQIHEAIGDKKNMAHNLGNIGLVYDDMGDYSTALDYVNRALVINKEAGNKKGLANNHRSIGIIYYHIATDTIGQPLSVSKQVASGLSIRYLNLGIAIAREIGDLNNLREMHDFLAKAYMANGNYKNALDNYRQYILYKDSIFSGQNAERITGLITQRELDIRDKEIEIKKQQIQLDKLAVAKKRNERIFYIGGMLVLIIIVIAVIKTNRVVVREKKKSEGLLLNILPTEIAMELKENGSAKARYFDDVTILFTDFVNFTGAGERMSSQELVDELNICFKEFDSICSRNKIEKIKTIGDAYLAVAGLPTQDPLHAQHVADAAIEIRDFMQRRYSELGDRTFEIRIGIHSGSVVAGIVGIKKFAYDIWGDTVNAAARMEQHSDPGKINISQNTYELLSEDFHCTYRGEILAKNKGMMQMYFLEKQMPVPA
jgi:class 3 adenylate cyclase/Tfp pilus assembly protein PilF